MNTFRPEFNQFAFERLKVRLAVKIGWMISNKPDCARLSELITESGSGNISESTLYRFFFKFESHRPYKHTLDIICRFLDYKDSLDFLEKIQESKEKLHASGIDTVSRKNNTLIYSCIENTAQKPLFDFFESIDENPHQFKVDLSIALFDALLETSRQQWFFKHFIRQKFIRRYLFETGHDPQFRIRDYDIAYRHYLEGIDRNRDVNQFQAYLFGNCVLFRYYFVSRQYAKALNIGKALYVAISSLEELASQLDLFPFIRFSAYKLWFLELISADHSDVEGYALYLIDLCRSQRSLCDFTQRKILFHTVAEAFVHSRVSEDFHLELKRIFEDDFKRLPPVVYSKHLRYSLPYFDENGLLHYRP